MTGLRAFADGLTGLFFGAHSGRFVIDGVVYEAMEDPDDGYRSMLDEVAVCEDQGPFGFFATPLATVRVTGVTAPRGEYGEGFDGYELVDVADGHIWLRFGTGNADDYYPMFIFEYLPKPNVEGPAS